MSDKQFTLYWRNGSRSVVTGETIEQAFTNAGHGAGAKSALDFYMDGDDTAYVWNKNTREWDRKEPFSFKAVIDSIKKGRYQLMVSHNLGASYVFEYGTDDKDDPELKRRMSVAKDKALRYYVEGDNTVVCDQHQTILDVLGASPTQRTIEEQATLLRNKFCK